MTIALFLRRKGVRGLKMKCKLSVFAAKWLDADSDTNWRAENFFFDNSRDLGVVKTRDDVSGIQLVNYFIKGIWGFFAFELFEKNCGGHEVFRHDYFNALADGCGGCRSHRLGLDDFRLGCRNTGENSPVGPFNDERDFMAFERFGNILIGAEQKSVLDNVRIA